MNRRDRAIERLLRESAGGPGGPPGPACVDSEKLAAWMDGSLGPSERRGVEAHLAGCPSCQAVAAAMARTMPVPERRVVVAWLAPTRWLVPITAAATAVAIWVLVPSRGPEVPAEPQQEVAARENVDQPLKQEAVAVRSDETQAAAPAASEVAPGGLAVEANEPARVATAAAGEETRQREAGGRAESAVGGTTAAARAVAEAAPKAAASEVGAQANARGAAPAEAPAVRAPATDARRLASELAADRAASPAPVAAFEVGSPDPTVRWRLGLAGVVEHTRDAGRSWEARPTGVDSLLRAGTAPTPDVCWLVGLRGTVVVATASGAWRRVQLPEAVDLAGVQAVDAVTATVTTVDGRVFRTTDGGATWRP